MKHHRSRESLIQGIVALCNRNLTPWSIMDPGEWARKIRRMPDEHGADKPFTFTYAPYELEPFIECLNPRNQEVVLQMFSRGGKSEIVLNVLGFPIPQAPGRIGGMWPELGQAEKWSKDDFSRTLIEPTPELFGLVGSGAGRRKSDNTLLQQLFSGGVIAI